MSQIKQLLVDQLQDLLHAEGQLLRTLPKMAEAAKHPRLRKGFGKHHAQTQGHVERLRAIFDLLGEKPQPKPRKAMIGLVAEGEETIQEGQDKDPLIADFALIAAAQRVEHYEISAYGTAKCLARQLNEVECAKLLSHTLGEEESTDFLLTAMAEPFLRQLSLDDVGANVNLETVGVDGQDRPPRKKTTGKKAA